MIHTVTTDQGAFESFGSYLKELRQWKGISKEAVAAEIKISLSQLEQIEAQDHEKLPDDVFVRGILKSYARFIGVDENDIIDRYMFSRGSYVTGACALAAHNAPEHNRFILRRPWFFLWSLLILIVISLLYMVYGMSMYSSPLRPFERNIDFQVIQQPHGIYSLTNRNGGWKLEIKAKEKTWVKIQEEDEEASEYTLFPMDYIEMAVSSRVCLQFDNGDGLSIKMNGHPIDVEKTTKDIITLDLP